MIGLIARLVLLAAFAALCAPAAFAQTSLAELATYLGPDREQRLVQGASAKAS